MPPNVPRTGTWPGSRPTEFPTGTSKPRTSPAQRDASAAAIAASGLVELGRLIAGERGAGYRRAAQDILASLASSYLTLGTPNEAVLAHSVGFLRHDSEVDVGLVYADYYLLEAISRLHRQ